MGTGKGIFDRAVKHEGEEYLLGTVVPFTDPDWDGPWDCTEFASYFLYQECKIIYGCDNDQANPDRAKAYSGWWARDARSKGKIVSIQEAAGHQGAFFLREPHTAGIECGHCAISDGKGGTIEAACRSLGVIRSHASGRPWSYGILVPGVDYGDANPVVVHPPLPPEGFTRLLYLTDPPMTGDDIKKLQSLLNTKSGLNFHIEEDGVFGYQTFNAVLAFQKKAGVIADGIFGKQTADALSK